MCVFSADEIPIRHLSGYELTCEYLEQRGFDVPIIVNKTDGLDLHLPPPTFTIQDVENCVGLYINTCSVLCSLPVLTLLLEMSGCRAALYP